MAVPTKLISTSVGFQDAKGNLVALGFLRLAPSGPAEVIASGGQITTQPLFLPLDANAKITATAIWFSDELNPAVNYSVQLYGSNGLLLINDFGYVTISGASFDLSLMVPTTQGSAGSAGVVLLNPGNVTQTISTGNLAITNNETIGGTLAVNGAVTFKTSPWYDVTAYGAVGDGTTDNTAAFQAALNAANTAHGGKVFVPEGTNGFVIAGQLVMDDFINVSIVAGTQGSPAGATPRGWLKFTGTSSSLISMKSCNGCTVKGLYLQYTNAGFTGTFIELGHSASAHDATGNRIEDNFIGKQAAGGSAAVLISLDQAINNIIENNQMFDAAVAIRGRNGPTGIAADYSVNNTIRNNSMGISSASVITTAFIQNIGEGSVIMGNDFELGGAAVSVLAYTGAMQAGGVISGGFVGDMTGTSTITLFTIPTNSAWKIEGVTIGAVSTNVTGVVMQNNSSLSFIGNKLASGTTIGTMFSVGTGDSLVVLGNKWQGAVSTFLTGTPASGVIEDSTSHVRLPTGTTAIPGIAFMQNNAIGFTISANNHLQVAYAGPGPFFSATQIAIGSGMALVSNANSDPDAVGADVGLSRVAAGVWGAGTGAAGDTAGEFRSAKIAATYNAAGTLQTAVHIVQGTVTLSGGTATVTLVGGAIFTNATSYTCVAEDDTAIAAVKVTQTSGSSITFTGTGTDVIRYICIGN